MEASDSRGDFEVIAGSRLVLGSGSPRRKQLLAGAGLAFDVVPADIVEQARPGETADALAERLACEKALAVARQLGPTPPRFVLGADTVVAVGERILGKPESVEAAVAMLEGLVGRRHRVITGVAAVASADLSLQAIRVESRVEMRPAERAELTAYVATGEPMDKAGAYALQGEGRRFVVKVEGSETNVIGLPVEETLALLRRAGAIS